jgi:PmbA protein
MTDNDRLKLAQWAMEQAIKGGAREAAVTISNAREVEVEYRDRRVENLKESTTNSLTLDLFVQDRYSSHSTNDMRTGSLSKLITEAIAATKYLAEDKSRSLPDPKYYPKSMDKELDLCDKSHAAVESSERKRIASEIEEAAAARSDKIISTTASYSDGSYELVKVHSNGFSGRANSTVFSAGASVTVKDPDGGRPEDWFYATTRFKNDLPSPETLGRNAADRALGRIGQKKIASGKYDMLVENRAGGRLVGMLIAAMAGRAIQQKQSYLDGMLLKKIAANKLSLTDDPWVKKGLGSRLFDGEALAAKRRRMIERGVLRNYYLDVCYSKKLETLPTSGSSSNLVFECGKKSPEQTIEDLNKAILVTGFIGGNSNSTTGDFSFGIIGHLIENGQVVAPVNEMNISGNAKEFWNSLVELCADPYTYSAWRVPTMLFESVSFSGV